MNIESDVVFQRLKRWLLRSAPLSSLRRIPMLNASIASDIGFKRTQNQDRVAIIKGQDFNGDGYILIALSDGMGGMTDGEKCAAITIAGFFSSFINMSRSFGMANDWLEQSAFAANKEIYRAYTGKGGATLSAILIREDRRIHWLNVGDSRIYFHRNETLQQITKDDTIAGQLGDDTEAYASRNELLQYIGIGNALEPHITKAELKENTSIILTSDGVHYLGNDLIQRIVLVAQDPGNSAKRLVEVAKYVSGHDNCSVAVIHADLELAGTKNSEPDQYEIWDPSSDIQILTIPLQIKTKKEPIIKENNTEKSDKNPDFKKTQRIKRTIRKPLSKKTFPEKDLLGDEIRKTDKDEDSNAPKFRMILNTQEK